MKRFLLVMLLSCTMYSAVGCASANYVSHPGAVNVFSSQAYDTLVATDAVIKATEADLNNNAFPVAWVPAIKKSLNVLIQSYDVANISWQAYNAAATPTNQTVLQQNLTSVNMATTALSTTKATGN